MCFFSEWGNADYLTNIKSLVAKDSTFVLEELKDELSMAIDSTDFDWVDLAIETKLVYTSIDRPSSKFTIDDLFIFIGNSYWGLNDLDGRLTVEDKEELRDQLREINIYDYEGIGELADSDEFSWLPFEVRHALKMNFGSIEYNNDDIIYYVKKIVWDYLFPAALDSYRLKKLSIDSHEILKNITVNNGWFEMNEILNKTKEIFSGVDLYELDKIEWEKEVENKIHYRNPFTLGFKRVKRNQQLIT